MRSKDEEGQAIVLAALAIGIFLLGAVGLAVDGGHLYAQRQMAQTAADAAAQAGIQSIFTGTNSAAGDPAAFSAGSAFTCGSSDPRTPCAYATKNGFDNSAGDTVSVDFPPDTAAPGVTFSASAPVNLIRVTIARNVKTTLMALLGTRFTTIKATAMAAIVNVVSPVPIIVTHPTLPGSFSANGNDTIQICGGPPRSIQVNSASSTAVSFAGSGGSVSIDLSHAGPPDPGNCTTGTGADFGVWGGPTKGVYSGVYMFGSTGHYQQPAEPIEDPLRNVAPPADPGFNAPNPTPLGWSTNGCPASAKKPCMLYSPGDYPTGINGDNSTPVFKPGIYYIKSNGITCHNNCSMYMATNYSDTTTGTGWTGNVLFYNTGDPSKSASYGPINISANGIVNLVGSPSGSSYLGILFFEDRNAPALQHTLSGGGGLTLLGTVYLTNPKATMLGNAAQYQSLSFQGNPGSSTYIQGEIIVGALSLGGGGTIVMNLNSNSVLTISQVALVN